MMDRAPDIARKLLVLARGFNTSLSDYWCAVTEPASEAKGIAGRTSKIWATAQASRPDTIERQR